MEVKESYDRWEADHPFRNKEHPIYRLIEKWIRDSLQASNRVVRGHIDEKRILEYILYSLNQRQEYDAGNAILWASQVGWLSNDALSMLADIFISKEIEFTSIVGKLIFIKIGRSVGYHLYSAGSKEAGNSLFKMAVQATTTIDYGRTEALKGWAEFKLNAPQLPNEMGMALKLLELPE